MQWLYEAFYSAIGELFADINDLGVEIFDLSWVQAVVSLFTMSLLSEASSFLWMAQRL